jgi:hypothetical protein
MKHEGLVTKNIMDDFRDELFRSMALPSPRDMSEVRKKDARLGMKRPLNIALYANGENGWKGLDKLVISARTMKKYRVVFNLIADFDQMNVAEQANAFNMADAVIMAAGEHMANALFSPDETFFAIVGAGCSSSQKSLTSNDQFMALLLGTHQTVENCSKGDEICVSCSAEGGFSMTSGAFRALLDVVMMRHEKQVTFERDSRNRD